MAGWLSSWCKWYFTKSGLNWLKLFLDWSLKKYVGQLSDLQKHISQDLEFLSDALKKVIGGHRLVMKSRCGFVNAKLCKMGSHCPVLIGMGLWGEWGKVNLEQIYLPDLKVDPLFFIFPRDSQRAAVILPQDARTRRYVSLLALTVTPIFSWNRRNKWHFGPPVKKL